ncbi:sensor histidine kinase [Cohnella terricola]|uniref:histidine kinase n=1 Tax=Cohnella terricola TaxID=1289167 RepID=A0A559JAG7_9BACL|nr:histidine kinase [Cohnella terricola]TVX96841.1 sensor histidine kinase [Cohnella terricola]
MDFWSIGAKSCLLVYVIAVSFFPEPSANPWTILVCLSYICLNIALPIFKHAHPKLPLACASIALAAYSAYSLNPAFLLLLPASLYELAGYVGRSKLLLIPAAIAPIPFVPHAELPEFLLAASLCLLLYAGGRNSTDKLARARNEADKMREELQRITRSLNENNEYIRRSEYTIKLEERNRLSQQIHDDIGHAMAGALIQMEASRRLLDADSGRASELLGNAISISKEGLEKIRLTLKDLKPKSEELGINRLRLLAEDLSVKHPVQASLSHQGDIDAVSPIQWKIIQENAVEAITNSLKYGKATSIHIEIQVLNKFVKSAVADNGIGAEKVVKGLGIVGMEERAASIGGTVIVDGTNGFSVTTLLPRGSE